MRRAGIRAIETEEGANDRLCAQLNILLGPRRRPRVPARFPRHIAHYELRKEIGAGAQSVVYRAWDHRQHRWVAIKILRAGANLELRQRFHREARCASALHHSNIVEIYDLIRQEAVDAIVMEYVPGRTLGQVIPKSGLALQTFLDYAQQIAGAVAEVHDSGMIHRDFKPANFVVTRSGTVKLLDFGMVKILSGERQRQILGCHKQLPITIQGTIMGTAGYMSPEQVRGQAADQRSDIFSLGVVFYEMLTGRCAFSHGTPIEGMGAILYQTPRRLPRRVRRPIAGIIYRCLAKEPTQRYRTVKDVILDLALAANFKRKKTQAAAAKCAALYS